MPFMIRRTIVNELQDIFITDRVLKLVSYSDKFPENFLRKKNRLRTLAFEYNITSSHRLRAKNDVQFAFAYYHYVNEQKKYKTKILEVRAHIIHQIN